MTFAKRCLVLLFFATIGSARGEGPPTTRESLAALQLADPSLRVELVASEPAVASPVAMAWDEHLRLFVVEMTDYPNARSGGRVKRLIDNDGDGVYESAAVFADGLKFPSGLAPWNGGWLVTSAPDLLFLKDNDGDGRADERRVILTGFHEGNQQLRVNSPTWGLDNWLYLANGRSGGAIRKPSDAPGQAVPIPRNDLRVRPSTGEFQPVAGFSQFGLPRDDWGDRFPSWNTVPLRHVVLELPEVGTTGGQTVAEILDLADGGRVLSTAPSQRRFNAESVAFFNATCGPTIYRGDILGSDYSGHAFVCEPLSSLVHHRRLDRDGVTFVARRVENEKSREFLASTHPWFRPVNLTSGPDGALYIADFCRAWVEHPDFVPKPLRDSVDFRVGHESGRIWRVVEKDGSRPRRYDDPSPAKATAAELVSLLTHPNGWWRDSGQRLLVERQDKASVDPLKRLAREGVKPLASIHALWTLDGLEALDFETLRLGLGNSDPRVREQALRLINKRPAEFADQLAVLADDPDPRIRLRVAVALHGQGRMDIFARLATRDSDSPWMASALLAGIKESPIGLLEAILRREPSWQEKPSDSQTSFLTRVSEIIGSRNRAEELVKVLDLVGSTRSDSTGLALLQGLAQGQTAHGGIPWTGAVKEPFTAALTAVAPLRERNPAIVAETGRPISLRLQAFAVLTLTNPASARELIPRLIEPDQPPEIQAAAARGFGRIGDAKLLNAILENWDRRSLATRRVLVSASGTSIPIAAKLLDGVEQGTIAPAEIDPTTREALARLNDPALRKRISRVLGQPPATNRADVVRKYENSLSLKSDSARGRVLFEKNCQTCHARGGPGPKVGPDLMSVAGRPPEYLLVSILDPAREAAPDGLGVVLVTKNGQTLTGLLAEETPASVRIRRAGGQEDVIPRTEIEAFRPTGRSLMPDGLEQVLSAQDAADLIAFLRTPTP